MRENQGRRGRIVSQKGGPGGMDTGKKGRMSTLAFELAKDLLFIFRNKKTRSIKR